MATKKTKTLPRQITVTITERDRLTADFFGETCSCLLATAVKRTLRARGMFRPRVEECVNSTLIYGELFEHENFTGDTSHRDYKALQKPFYHPEVVGTKIVLRRAAK